MTAYPERLTNEIYTRNSFKLSRRSADAPYHLHWHEFYEIEIFISGACEFTVNGKNCTVCGGDVTIVSPVDFHSMRPLDGERAEYYNIMISEECISDMLSAMMNCLGLPITVHPSDESFKNIITLCGMLENSTAHAFKDHYAKNLLECIVMDIISGAHGAEKVECDSFYSIRGALSYIRENFTAQITLSDIAAHCGYSESYMSRKFREFTGKKFSEYLAEARCRYAKTLIASTDMSINAICFKSGFNSFSQFSRSFKKYCGAPPLSFRKPEFKE